MARLLNPKVGALLWILVISALPALMYIGLILKTNVFGWIVFRLVVAALPSPDLEKACETKILQQLQSPDGVRSVVLEEKGCDFGFGVGYDNTIISLTSLAHPDQSTDLILSETFLHDDEHIRVSWLGPDRLRITLPLFFVMTILTREAEGVHLDIKFDPDDPAARVAWLAKRDELGRAQDAYLHMGPPPADPAAKSAWFAKDEEVRRTFGQTFKEVEDIKSRAAARNRGAP